MEPKQVLVAAMLAVAAVAGCSSEDPTPAEEPATSVTTVIAESPEPDQIEQTKSPEPEQTEQVVESAEFFDSLVPVMEALDAGGVPCDDPTAIDLGAALEIRVCSDNGPILNRYDSASEAAEQGLREAEIGFSIAQGDIKGLLNAWLQVNNVMVDCGAKIEQCEAAQSVLGGEVMTFAG